MNRAALRCCVCVLALLAGIVASGAATAQTTTSYPVSATCTGGGQLCNNIANVSVTTTGLLQAEFTPGSFACSSVAIHFLVDGTQVAVTGFVGPGGSPNTGLVNLGPVSAGAHTVGLQAEGTVGGCNVGTLGSWGGTVQITTAGASQPIPALSRWGVAVLLSLLAISGVVQIRRRAHRG